MHILELRVTNGDFKVNNYNPDKMTLTQLQRMDIRRVPDAYDEQGSPYATINYELLDSYGNRVSSEAVHADEERYRIGMNGYWSMYQDQLCRRENAAPKNLTKDVRYASDVFEFDEEKRALLRNLEPVGLRALSWK